MQQVLHTLHRHLQLRRPLLNLQRHEQHRVSRLCTTLWGQFSWSPISNCKYFSRTSKTVSCAEPTASSRVSTYFSTASIMQSNTDFLDVFALLMLLTMAEKGRRVGTFLLQHCMMTIFSCFGIVSCSSEIRQYEYMYTRLVRNVLRKCRKCPRVRRTCVFTLCPQCLEILTWPQVQLQYLADNL